MKFRSIFGKKATENHISLLNVSRGSLLCSYAEKTEVISMTTDKRKIANDWSFANDWCHISDVASPIHLIAILDNRVKTKTI